MVPANFGSKCARFCAAYAAIAMTRPAGRELKVATRVVIIAATSEAVVAALAETPEKFTSVAMTLLGDVCAAVCGVIISTAVSLVGSRLDRGTWRAARLCRGSGHGGALVFAVAHAASIAAISGLGRESVAGPAIVCALYSVARTTNPEKLEREDHWRAAFSNALCNALFTVCNILVVAWSTTSEETGMVLLAIGVSVVLALVSVASAIAVFASAPPPQTPK